MLTGILLDLAVVAVVALFVCLGAKKGFVLTLCSLAAALVALIGASLVADTVSPMLADALQPKLEQSIREGLEEHPDSALDPASAEVLSSLREKGGLYAMAADAMADIMEGFTSYDSIPTVALAVSMTAAQLAGQLARGILFVVSFFVLLIAWGILSHALNLVTRLPVLHQLNSTLGGILGLVKGLLIAYLAAWVLCNFTGYITAQMLEESSLFSLLAGLHPLDFLLAK